LPREDVNCQTRKLRFLLRTDFRQEIQADLDETHRWQLHRRYPADKDSSSIGDVGHGV